MNNNDMNNDKGVNINSKGHVRVNATNNTIDDIPLAEPIYSTKMSASDEIYNDIFMDGETYPSGELLRVSNEMNRLFSLQYTLKCFMVFQIISACLYSSLNPFFFLFLFFNCYAYKSIVSYNKKGVLVYSIYMIIVNVLRFVFFVWTMASIHDFDTGDSYNNQSGNYDGGNNGNDVVATNNTSNIVYIFHYGPTGYTILFYCLNTIVDIWFIKLMYMYYKRIRDTSIIEINHLIEHGGHRKFIILW
jgi:hypothetical protein